MSIHLEDTINYEPKNRDEIINVYYTIDTHSLLPYIVFYLKLNNSGEYDSFITDEEFDNIYRSCNIVHRDIIRYNGMYYRICQVDINERLYRSTNKVATVTPYEIIHLKRCGFKKIESDFVSFINYNECLTTLYDIDDHVMLNPWVFFKTIDVKHIEFIELFGFMREFHDNIPSYKVYYSPEKKNKNDKTKQCIRTIVFMDEITLNYEYATRNDIRKDCVFIGDYSNCIYYGTI